MIGQPPVEIVYLRMFDNEARARSFLESAWREFGYVYLLQSAQSVAEKKYRKGRRAPGGFFVADDADLIARIDQTRRQRPLRRGRHTLSGVRSSSVAVKDKYGAYPFCAVPCHVSYWQRAVDLLLARVDVVVLDLSGVTKRNPGTLYELQRIIDIVPIERVILLCDPKSNQRYLRSVVESAWSQMSASSPNASGTKRRLRCGVTDSIRRVVAAQPNPAGGGYVGGSYRELRSNRKASRRVAAAAQKSAMTAPRIR